MKVTEEQSLLQIEKLLKKNINNVVVVSEITIEQHDLEIIVQKIKTLFTNNTEEEKIIKLWTTYPNVSLIATVFIAVYKYKSNFWGNFTQITGIENTNLWRDSFWSYIKSKNIQTFRENNRKYVNTILGHAGIPYFCVPRLLENAIIPAIDRGLNEIDIYENTKKNEYENLLLKGVLSFIQLGGRVPLSMIQRIQNIWRSQNKPFTNNFEGYLPNHILQALDKFEPQESGGHLEYKRPIVLFDEKARIITLSIPGVRIDKKEAEQVYWEIVDSSKKTEATKINMEEINYKDSNTTEYIPEMEFFPLKPNRKYLVTLRYKYSSKIIFEEKINTNPILISFNKEKRFHRLVDAYLDKEYETLSLIVKNDEINVVKNEINLASITIEQLNNKWKNYSAVYITVNGKETIKIAESLIYLNQTIEPNVDGEKQNHLVHSEYPLFIRKPYLVLPDYVTQDVIKGNLTHVRLRNHWTNQITMRKVNKNDIIYLNGETRIYFDELFTETDDKIITYTLSLSGRLGYDYTYTFMLMHDFQISLGKNNRNINIRLPFNYSLIVQWPLDVEVARNRGSYDIVAPENQYKLLISIFNHKDRIKNDFILYSSLYNIRFIGNENIYPLGSEISRIPWNQNSFEIEIDTTNPSFGKEIGSTTKLEIEENQRYIEFDISSDSVSYFSDEKLNKNVDESLFYNYRFNNIKNNFAPLITIRNQWELGNLEWDLNGLILDLKWEQSNYINEKFIRIWKLNKPLQECIDIPLTKRKRTFSYKFDEPGIFLLEWKDINAGDVLNKPSFEVGKSKIFRIGTNKTLANLLLNREEYQFNEIQDLLKGIHLFGEKYLSLIIDDYDACCDFGIRIGDYLEEIYINKRLSKQYVSILTKITGLQELDGDTLFLINHQILNKKYKDNFLDIKDWYFSQDKLIKSCHNLKPRQLNIKMQELKTYSPIIYDFSLQNEMVRFLYKMRYPQGNEEYINYINRILDYYNDEIKDCIKLLKREKSNSKYWGVFNEIERRNYNGKLDFNDDNQYID